MKTIRDLFGLLLILGVVSFGASPAWARIGGGQHYSGSRSSSSSSSRSSSGYGSHSYGSGYHGSGGSAGAPGCGGCCVLILILGIVGYILWQKKRGGPVLRVGQPTTAPSGPPPRAYDAREGWVQALRSKDPAFELGALYQKAADIFVRSQQAWSTRDLVPVRPFMSDATYQRFETQLELMRAQNVRNVTADQRVDQVELIGIEQNPNFDTVHLAIRASMRDVDVPWDTAEADAQARAQRASDSSFTEIWSFVRKPGVQTQAGKELTQGKCPNCGAPFAGGAANTCQYCGAVVNSGNYDWTLAEITQDEERDTSVELPPGLDELRADDPAFSLEVLEDRTSLIFWKWIEARTFGEPGRIAKVATPEYLHQLETQLAGNRERFSMCAVGAVVTRNLSLGEGARALVEVRWSADTVGGDPIPRTSTFELARGPGAKTNAANGMATARCPNCNAPLSSSVASHCEFCGATLVGNPSEWLVSAVRSEEEG